MFELKGSTQILNTLNANLKMEITAINQLFLHARIAKIWGVEKFNQKIYSTSIESMKMADTLIDRILFLEGLPNLQDLGKVLVGENIEEIVDCDLNFMKKSRNQLQESIQICEQELDYESRAILVRNLDSVEEYIDWLEAQTWLIESMGIENYTQSQI